MKALKLKSDDYSKMEIGTYSGCDAIQIGIKSKKWAWSAYFLSRKELVQIRDWINARLEDKK